MAIWQVQEVTKEVVRPIYEAPASSCCFCRCESELLQVTEKIVEVPHILVQERIEEAMAFRLSISLT